MANAESSNEAKTLLAKRGESICVGGKLFWFSYDFKTDHEQALLVDEQDIKHAVPACFVTALSQAAKTLTIALLTGQITDARLVEEAKEVQRETAVYLGSKR